MNTARGEKQETLLSAELEEMWMALFHIERKIRLYPHTCACSALGMCAHHAAIENHLRNAKAAIGHAIDLEMQEQ